MSKRSLPRLFALLAMLSPAGAVPPGPAWWSAAHASDPATPTTLDVSSAVNANTPNNKGPANIGQAKHMARSALLALRASGQTQMANGIEAALVGPPDINNPSLSPPLASWAPPTTPPEQEKQKAPLLVGQLKAIAAPFYLALHTAAPAWLDHESANDAEKGQLQLNGTKDPDPIHTDHYYPWTFSETDDQNESPATIGQLKAVFSLRFESLPLPFIDDDDDRMDDNWELANGLDPTNRDDSYDDSDFDGISNLYEYLLGLDPWDDSTNGTPDTEKDSDGDGMPDFWEVTIGHPDDPWWWSGDQWLWNEMLQRYEFVRLLDWENPADAALDPDADGLTNLAEYQNNTDPFNSDIDGDHLPDGWEIAHGLDPHDWSDAYEDPDGDGIETLYEFLLGFDHTTADPAQLTADRDSDGMPDWWEASYAKWDWRTNAFTRRLDWRTDDAVQDPDTDGLTNLAEYQNSSDPFDPDTDGDGVSDWDEIMVNFTNPLSATDADGDGIPDDFEKHFAKLLLAYQPEATHWGANHAGLLAGNLDATHDYTGDGMNVGELAEILKKVPAAGPADSGYSLEQQGRHNSLPWTYYFPPPSSSSSEGAYSYSVPNDYDVYESMTPTADLSSQYLLSRIDGVAWGRPWIASGDRMSFYNGMVESAFRRSYVMSPDGTKFQGRISQQRCRLIATTPGHEAYSRTYLKVIKESNYFTWDYRGVISAEPFTVQFPKGRMLSDWYEFKAPIVDESGGRGAELNLLPVEIAVDADRDGEITFDGKDKTTAEKPYRFWINDDVDKGNTVDGNDYEEDDLNESAKDSEDGKLKFRRDLEDLTRLWIDFSGINSVFPASDPSVALKVRIEADAGSPVINLYQPVETDGGREYLKDENTGYNQLQGIYGQQLCQVTSAATVVPRRAWETLPSDKVVHLLFEGATEGNGKLIFEIWKDGEKKCDLPSVNLNLKKAKDMYETWTVGDVDAGGVDFTKWPAASATQTSGQNIPAPEKPEEKDYIMFVHGWNMPPWEKETFASTMFKRMWHQGYKGRFGAFRWPTFYGLSGPSWGNLKGENIHTAHFDGSEQRAWNSASALKNLLIGREAVFGTNKIRLYAHSMGNIVSSEALRQMAPSSHVNTYISAQAAISSHVWDNTTPRMTFNAPLGLNTPNVYGYYWQSTAALPPHNWENEGRPSYMAPQYMPSGTTYINHYNPLDWALSYDNWQLNQVLKPDVDYNYGWPALDFIDISLRFWKTQSIPPFRNLTFPNDRFEVFSYAAQSHGYATGQQGATAGKFNVAASVNLRGEYGFESAHKGHSAQFRSTIQKRWTYWRRALKDMNINLPTP